MGGYSRNYIRAGQPMFRAVIRLPNGKLAYRGPYGTPGAAKGQRSKVHESWVEVCFPTWERLEE